MANRKSSITAEVKVAGLAKFKSDLSGVSSAAKKTGKDISAVRAPDLTLTPAYQYWEARKRGEQKLTAMTKAEAEKRVKIEEQAAARSATAMRTVVGGLQLRKMQLPDIERNGAGRWDHLSGSQFAGGTRGISGKGKSNYLGSAGYGLSVGYNAIQDLAQGGVAGIANNVPQIVDLVSKSPSLKMAGAATAAAASGYFAYDQLKKAWDNFTGNKLAARQMASIQQLQTDYQEYEHQKQIRGIERDSGRLSRNMANNALFEARAQDGVTNANALKETERRGGVSVARSEIKDENAIELAKKLAAFDREEENRQIEVATREAARLHKVASDNQIMANRDFELARARVEELQAMEDRDGAALSKEQEKELATVQATLAAYQAISEAADARMKTAEAISEGLKRDTIELKTQQMLSDQILADAIKTEEARALSENRKADEDGRDMMIKIKAFKDFKEGQKIEKERAMNKEAGDLNEREAMSKMSPRKLEKYQRQKRVDEEKKRLMAIGYDAETATGMAERGEKLNDRAKSMQDHPGRIRGAGYDNGRDSRRTGLGTTSFSGLDELAAMQGDPMPGKPEARSTKGAGYKEPKQRGDSARTGPDPVGAQIVKELQALRQEVRASAPDRKDRAKPISTTSR